MVETTGAPSRPRAHARHAKRPPRTALQCYLGLQEAEAIRALAEKRDLPVTALLREAVRSLLAQEAGR